MSSGAVDRRVRRGAHISRGDSSSVVNADGVLGFILGVVIAAGPTTVSRKRKPRRRVRARRCASSKSRDFTLPPARIPTNAERSLRARSSGATAGCAAPSCAESSGDPAIDAAAAQASDAVSVRRADVRLRRGEHDARRGTGRLPDEVRHSPRRRHRRTGAERAAPRLRAERGSGVMHGAVRATGSARDASAP